MVPSLAHSHGCHKQPACHSTALKQQVTCMTFELGCVAHSVVLGLALGVMTVGIDMVITLTVVLAVHQAVEGLALGSVLAATPQLSRRKKYVLALVYAVTLPAGIAAGLLASNSYDPTAPVAVLVQGVANGLSGGLLLYVSMFSLLGAELSQHDLLHRPLLAAGLMLAALFGAAVMCVIGLWA
jgi:zinc transporter 1/2/3